jgi:hypothetical protein
LGRLFGHGAGDLGNAVADADDRGLACAIEESASVGCVNPAAFAADSNRKGLAEIARKERRFRRHAMSRVKL